MSDTPTHPRHARRRVERGPSRRAVLASATALGAGLVLTRAATVSAQSATLTVNAASAYRPTTRAIASGGLYALKDDEVPSDDMIMPLRMHSVTQPAPRVQQQPNGQPPGGDALITAPKADRVGATVIIRMPDIYPNFPYQWVSWDDWLARVDTQVGDRLAATEITNIEGWELWNEPDWTWDTAAAGPFNDGWATTFQRVRAGDPETPIVGPSFSWYDGAAMRDFLSSAVASGTVPDIICWHELGGPVAIESNVADYRAAEGELGIGPLPIAINEYGTPEEMNIPGVMASYLAKFERAQVRSAHRAFWNEYGTVGGLLTPEGLPTGVYWLYVWYGEMTGDMVESVPPATTGIDGLASHDPSAQRVDVLFGNESGDNTIHVTGLADFGAEVDAILESAPTTDRFTHVEGPTLVSETTHAVSNGEVSIPVTGMDAAFAYRLAITPTGG
ncbi:RICIN domain-containing protein [Streptomyces sp. 6N223]|uniref:RICIN domain-containing protein n=1 Tax=Streptomyces sp. 6N223 TaxID=3457412 RepID=UPI003FD30F59